jgi:transcriptional regulator with XRE-family HTH domain
VTRFVAPDESFGRRLRRERERRQIALTSIAENSKISLSLLQALERDDVSRWPSGIFRRSFIRAYARGVGLDPDEIASEFQARFPDPNDPDRAFVAAVPPPPASSLRLTLADTHGSFSRGPVLRSFRSRWAAVGCDGAVVATLALVFEIVLGTVWMPLTIALAGYYAGSILLLGNTPGVCLFGSGGGGKGRPGGRWRPVASWFRIRSRGVPGLGHGGPSLAERS